MMNFWKKNPTLKTRMPRLLAAAAALGLALFAALGAYLLVRQVVLANPLNIAGTGPLVQGQGAQPTGVAGIPGSAGGIRCR